MCERIAQKVCTRTHQIVIHRLKGIRSLDVVSLEDQPITGLFGPNGAGKTTILHALAAAYRQPEHSKSNDLTYNRFFPRLTEDTWNGTKFTITHSGLAGRTHFTEAEESYQKGEATTRWKPLRMRRPEREVLYVGLQNCIPSLERYATHDLQNASYYELKEKPEMRALKTLGKALNSEYEKSYRIRASRYPFQLRKYSAFQRSDLGCRYSSLTMGSGEQRLFDMLTRIERTRNHALILIDEIDLLLHGEALKKLIDSLHKLCTKSQRQIVFTSHREELLQLDNQINIRHIFRNKDSHRCFNDTDPDSLQRLTGKRTRPIEIFVEDSLAQTIVEQVCSGLGVKRHVQIFRFGCATNCFTVAAGLLLKGDSIKNSIFVLDGEEQYRGDNRTSLIKKACGGNDSRAVEIRGELESVFLDFNLPQNRNPEEHLHSLIIEQNDSALSPGEREIWQIARQITNPQDHHQFVDKIVQELGGSRSTQLQSTVELASKHRDWSDYISPIKGWLNQKITELGLGQTE